MSVSSDRDLRIQGAQPSSTAGLDLLGDVVHSVNNVAGLLQAVSEMLSPPVAASAAGHARSAAQAALGKSVVLAGALSMLDLRQAYVAAVAGRPPARLDEYDLMHLLDLLHEGLAVQVPEDPAPVALLTRVDRHSLQSVLASLLDKVQRLHGPAPWRLSWEARACQGVDAWVFDLRPLQPATSEGTRAQPLSARALWHALPLLAPLGLSVTEFGVDGVDGVELVVRAAPAPAPPP